MTNTLEYLLKTFLYFTIVLSIYYAFSREQKNAEKKVKIVGLFIAILSFGIYGVICGTRPYLLDRAQYALRFSSDIYYPVIKRSSIGLYYIFKLLHCFTYKPEALFFFISGLYMLITIKAYKEYNCNSQVLIILLISSYGLLGFYMYKQCIAIALVSLSFAYLLNKKKLKSILTLVIAMLFHEATIMAIVIYICLIVGNKNKFIRIMTYIIAFGVIFTFTVYSTNIINLLIRTFPALEIQLSEYITKDGKLILNYNFMTILKGLPYYLITIYGFYRRKKLKATILNYDAHLIAATFTSLTYILSLYMYWMWRFGSFFYFPTIVFMIKLFPHPIKNKYTQFYYWIILISFFILSIRTLLQYYFIYGGIG